MLSINRTHVYLTLQIKIVGCLGLFLGAITSPNKPFLLCQLKDLCGAQQSSHTCFFDNGMDFKPQTDQTKRVCVCVHVSDHICVRGVL